MSDKILTAPVSPLGQDTQVKTTNATCMALPTDHPMHLGFEPDSIRIVASNEMFEVTYRRTPSAATPAASPIAMQGGISREIFCACGVAE